MDAMKKKKGQNVLASVTQNGELPSSSSLYSAMNRMGLDQFFVKKKKKITIIILCNKSKKKKITILKTCRVTLNAATFTILMENERITLRVASIYMRSYRIASGIITNQRERGGGKRAKKKNSLPFKLVYRVVPSRCARNDPLSMRWPRWVFPFLFLWHFIFLLLIGQTRIGMKNYSRLVDQYTHHI